MEVSGFQNRRRYSCDAALREIKDAEERGQLKSRELLLPPHWEEGAGIYRLTFTHGFILPGTAVSQNGVPTDGCTVMRPWIVGRERNSWLKERYFLQLHQTTVPPD